MAIAFCLRRRQVSGSQNQYLFLTTDKFKFNYQGKLIAPTLPGNNASTIDGASSTNFIFNIGAQGVSISASGVLQPVASTDLPATLPSGSDRYIIGEDSGGSASVSASPVAITGYAMRGALLDYLANQANTAYDSFSLGWPDWNPAGVDSPANGKDYDTIAGVKYRMFKGMVRDSNFEETSGELEQFPFSISFQVGNTL